MHTLCEVALTPEAEKVHEPRWSGSYAPRAMRLLVPLLFLTATACHHRFPLPYTSEQLVRDSANWPGEGLVHYLKQPNADVTVCTLAAPNIFRRTDDQLVDPFVAALEENKLGPERWQSCATRLVPALPPASRELVYGRLARVILRLLEGEQSMPRLIAANEVLATRPQEPSQALEELLRSLRQWPRQKLPPALPPVFDTLLATLELDHGQLAGAQLTVADINNTQDQALLMRMAARLPDVALRTAARRNLIKLRIGNSQTAEVRARAAEVEAAVMETGRWAQPVARLQLARPGLPLALPFTALVRQDVERQVVTLLIPGERVAQLLPVVDLKPSLAFSVVGWGRTLALCQAPSALWVEPCIDAREVEVANPIVSFDAEGVVRLPERLSMTQAMELARGDQGLVLPVRLGGKLVTSLQVPLRFEVPGAIRFESGVGEHGPAVNVAVQPVASALLFSAVSETGLRRMAVLPRGVSSSFEVTSHGGRGATGRTGASGYDGTTGHNGMSASCPSIQGQSGGQGGEGGRGGEGGPGGHGGDGGFVSVVVQCGGSCPADEAFVRRLIFSRAGEGGEGGAGGRGGRGGNGGSGGSGTSCSVNGHSTYVSGGSSGSRGPDGPQGPNGPDGSEGRAGPVRVQVQ